MVEQKRVGTYFVVLLKAAGARGRFLELKVNRQVAGAVQRSRVKRVVREFFRRPESGRPQNQLLAGKTVVCIARPSAGTANNNELFQDLSSLFP